MIAARLGLKPEEIWPSRYTEEGLPKAGLHIRRPGTVSDARGTEQSMTNAAQTNKWFTLAELAALDLPGIPTTRRGLALQAQREEWGHPAEEGRLWRRRKGRGGGIEYWTGVLPSFTQAKLLAKEAAQNPAPSREATLQRLGDEAAWQAYDRAADKHKQRAAKRVAVLGAVETLVSHGQPRTVAIMEVAATHGVSRTQIYAWAALVDGVPRAHWLPRLVPQYVGTKGPRAACDDDAWEWLRARYQLPNRPTFEACWRDLQQVAAQKGWRLPSARTLRRRISKFTEGSFRENDGIGAKSEGESEDTTAPSGEISPRLERAIAQAGGPSAVARRAEMYLGTLNRYRAGRELPSSALVSLARATAVRLEWLATGEGPMQADQEVVTTSAPLPGYVLLPLMEARAATGNNGDLSGYHNAREIEKMEAKDEAGTPVPPSDAEGGSAQRVERLREAIKMVGSARDAARLSGLPYGTLQNYIRGGEMKLSNAVSLTRVTGVRLEWLANGSGPMQAEETGEVTTISAAAPPPGYVLLPPVEARAAAGNNGGLRSDHLVDFIAFSESFLKQILRRAPQNLALLTASGDSMDPTIRDRDLLLVDTSARRIEGSFIYVLAIGGGLQVKRIDLRRDGSVILKSDNPKYAAEEVPAAETPTLEVLGQVIWQAGPVRS